MKRVDWLYTIRLASDLVSAIRTGAPDILLLFPCNKCTECARISEILSVNAAVQFHCFSGAPSWYLINRNHNCSSHEKAWETSGQGAHNSVSNQSVHFVLDIIISVQNSSPRKGIGGEDTFHTWFALYSSSSHCHGVHVNQINQQTMDSKLFPATDSWTG